MKRLSLEVLKCVGNSLLAGSCMINSQNLNCSKLRNEVVCGKGTVEAKA